MRCSTISSVRMARNLGGPYQTKKDWATRLPLHLALLPSFWSATFYLRETAACQRSQSLRVPWPQFPQLYMKVFKNAKVAERAHGNIIGTFNHHASLPTARGEGCVSANSGRVGGNLPLSSRLRPQQSNGEMLPLRLSGKQGNKYVKPWGEKSPSEYETLIKSQGKFDTVCCTLTVCFIWRTLFIVERATKLKFLSHVVIFVILFHVSECFCLACMSVHHVPDGCPQGQEEDVRSPRTRVIDSCELSSRSWKLKVSPLSKSSC